MSAWEKQTGSGCGLKRQRASASSLSPEPCLLRVELKSPIGDLVELASTKAATERPDALLISGLEMTFQDLHSEHRTHLIKQLNQERERLDAAVPCVLLLRSPGVRIGLPSWAERLRAERRAA